MKFDGADQPAAQGSIGSDTSDDIRFFQSVHTSRIDEETRHFHIVERKFFVVKISSLIGLFFQLVKSERKESRSQAFREIPVFLRCCIAVFPFFRTLLLLRQSAQNSLYDRKELSSCS